MTPNPDRYTPPGVMALDPANWPELDEDDLPQPRDLGVPIRSWDELEP